jgi:cob(I)alamin adenosyltransferase
MVLLSRIYTRGGDKGRTALGDGRRVAKHALRVEAYGTVDEANAAIGMVRLHADAAADAMLGRIQNDLFDLGADLCRPESPGDAAGPAPLRVTAGQVLRLESEIDAMNAALEPLRSFVLPGGTPAAAHLHLARTITRRAERRITALMERETVNPDALRYCNRLSDHLFVMARWVNRQAGGTGDVLWVPGATRT